MKTATRDRIAELLAEQGSEGLTVSRIVQEIKRKDSPLHGEVTWNKNEAFEIYLQDRARQLIREWYVFVQSGEETVVRMRGAYSLPTTENLNRPRAYFAKDAIFADSDMTNTLLQQAMRELSAFRIRYRNLSALSGVMDEIAKLREDDAKAA